MDNYYIWKYNLQLNAKEYANSLAEDTPCSLILGIFMVVPTILYIVVGLLYILLIVAPIQLFSIQKKNKIHPKQVIVYPNDSQIVDIVVDR